WRWESKAAKIAKAATHGVGDLGPAGAVRCWCPGRARLLPSRQEQTRLGRSLALPETLRRVRPEKSVYVRPPAGRYRLRAGMSKPRPVWRVLVPDAESARRPRVVFRARPISGRFQRTSAFALPGCLPPFAHAFPMPLVRPGGDWGDAPRR